MADVSMPAILTLIVCSVILGAPDENSKYTGWRPSEWDTSNGVMHCRRHEIELYDPAVDKAADPQPFNTYHCNWAALRQGPGYDIDRAMKEKDLPVGSKGWRFWKSGCPVPIMDDNGTPNNPRDDKLIGWKIPDCNAADGTVLCEMDSAI